VSLSLLVSILETEHSTSDLKRRTKKTLRNVIEINNARNGKISFFSGLKLGFVRLESSVKSEILSVEFFTSTENVRERTK
jgi:hypothetical protein